MPDKDLNIEQVPVQRSTTNVRVPVSEATLRERAKAAAIQEHENLVKAYREAPEIQLPDWWHTTYNNLPDNPWYNALRSASILNIGRNNYNTAFKEYQDQHPVSKLQETAWAAGSAPSSSSDAVFSNWAGRPTNLRDEDAYKYAVEKSGYDPGNPNDFWRFADKQRDATSLAGTKMALELPLIAATGAGAFGTLPRIGMNLAFAYDGYKGLTSPEGWRKTADFINQGRYGRAAWSGLGDLFNVSLMTPILRPILNPIKNISKGILNTAKFNFMNRGTGFRMDYPWQNTIGTSVSGLPTVFNPSNSKSAVIRFQNPLKVITSGRSSYQAPQTTIKSAFPQMAYTLDYGYASPDITTGNLAQIDNFLKKDIIPRMQRAGHNIDDTVTLPSLRVRDPNNIMDQFYNSNAGAYFDPVTNTATFRTLPEKADFGLSLHEIFGHGLRYNIHPDYKPISTQSFERFLQKCKELGINPNGQTILGLNTADQLYTDVEKSLLDTAYEKWFDYGEGAGNRHEYGAVNTQLRGKISQQNGHVVGKELDPMIDKYPDARLLVMLRDQPYTGNGTIKILENITGLDPDDLQFMSEIELNNIVKIYPEISKLLKRIKDTMKYVGTAVPVGIGTAAISKEKKGGKFKNPLHK